MDAVENAAKVISKVGGVLPTRDALLRTLHEQQQQIAQLHEDLDSKRDIIEQKSDVIDNQKQRIALLEEYLRLARHQRFGNSSEKNLLQLLLFNELELQGDGVADVSGEIDDTDDTTDNDKPRRKRGRKGLNPDLPREQVYHHLSDEEKVGASETFFVKVKEELDIEPAKARVIEHLQEKAVFVDDKGQRTLKAATRTPHPLGKAIASVSLLAYLIVSKYADGLPLYRLEGILKRYGGDITRTSMANWLIRLAVELQPVVNLMEDELLRCNYLMGDETRMKVLKEPGTTATSHKYMWVMRGGPPAHPVVMFNYDKSRGKAVAERLLEGYEGTYFQSDGYAGYDGVCTAKNIVHLGCWDHARRRFTEVIKAMPTAMKSDRPSKAQIALSKINALYAIERKMDKLELDADEKKEYRQQHSVPKLTLLKTWLETNAPKVDKDSKTYQAINYTLNQWPKLTRYCEDGSLRISNVLTENAIRPFAVGRKAWMFADTPAGARASAMYYSLIETAKANNVEPFEYLKCLIGQIATADTVEAYEALLPWNMK